MENFEGEVSVCIAIQKLGQGTVKEIQEKILEWGLKLTTNQVSRICKKLQKRGLISMNYVKEEDENLPTLAYSLSKAIFSRDIPIANYKDIVDYPEAKELIAKLEEKKNTSKGRLPDHRKNRII